MAPGGNPSIGAARFEAGRNWRPRALVTARYLKKWNCLNSALSSSRVSTSTRQKMILQFSEMEEWGEWSGQYSKPTSKKAFGMKLASRLALQVVKLKPCGAGMLLTLWHEFIF